MRPESEFRVTPEEAERFGHVAVLMGGDSAERSVSLKSGQAVAEALWDAGVDAHAVNVRGKDILRLAERNAYDRCFIALHGRGGEDGTVQAILDQAGIPYTGSGVLASALAMDKLRSKYVFAGASLPTPSFRLMTDAAQAPAIAQSLTPPLGVKPAREGSSIGVYQACDSAQLGDAFHRASQYDPLVLVEDWVRGSEYTVSVLGSETLPVIGLATDHAFYDFEAKYLSDDTSYLLPSGLNEQEEQQLRALSLEAFRVLGARDWGRVDAMRDGAGQFWLLEVNTIPGMTDHSLVPMAAEAAGIDFRELAVRIIRQSLEVGP